MEKILKFSAIGLIFFLVSVKAIFAGYVKGKITDAESGEFLIGANIRIEGSAFGAMSGNGGRFLIKHNIKAGEYRLLISMIGYNTMKQRISVPANETLILDIELSPQPLQMGEVVVSANKRIQAVQEVPISVSVMDNRVLMERNITKIDEALAYIPGIQIKEGNVDIRGSSGFSFGTGSRVALLLDGFPLLSADNGDMKFDALPLFDIERIEVVKGAGSALYGTSAMGGVVNIITEEPSEKAEFDLRTFTGIWTEPRYKQWHFSDKAQLKSGIEAGYSQKFDELGVMLSGAYYDDESYRLYDDSKRYTLFGKVAYDFNKNTGLKLSTNYAYENRTDWVFWNGLDSATYPEPTADFDSRFISWKYALFADLKHIFTSEHFINIKSGVFITDFETQLSDRSVNEYRQSTAYSYNTEAQMNSRFGSNLMLTYGLNHNLNLITSFTYGDKQQNIISAYAQAEDKLLNSLTLNAGLRFDHEQTEGLDANIELSPKFGALWESPFGVNFRLSAGKGFRAPRVVERFTTVTFSGFNVVPNPDLDAEKSWSYEAGANYGFDLFGLPFETDISFFRSELFDLIEPQLTGTDIKFENVTRARITGVELSLKGMLGFAGFESSLTWMDPRDLTLDEVLKYRSKVLWYSRLIIPVEFIELQADYRYMSEFVNIDDRLRLQVKDSEAKVPAHIVDARLIFKLNKISSYPVSISLLGKNIFDYYYTEIPGNLGPTRWAGIQADVEF